MRCYGLMVQLGGNFWWASMIDIQNDAQKPTPQQCRAARAVLNWSLVEASRRTGLSIVTISRSERHADPDRHEDARDIVKKHYETAGVSFLQLKEGRGVLLTEMHHPVPC